MNVLTVYAHPNPKSFCRAILERFSQGLEDAGHTNEVVDLYAIRFDPVFRVQDFASYVHESMPLELLDQMNLKKDVLESAGGPTSTDGCFTLDAGKRFPGSGEVHPCTQTQ